MARSVTERAVMSVPFQMIWPLVAGLMPMIVRARLVLPPPFGPVTTTKRLSGMSSVTPRRMSTSPPSPDTR